MVIFEGEGDFKPSFLQGRLKSLALGCVSSILRSGCMTVDTCLVIIHCCDHIQDQDAVWYPRALLPLLVYVLLFGYLLPRSLLAYDRYGIFCISADTDTDTIQIWHNTDMQIYLDLQIYRQEYRQILSADIYIGRTLFSISNALRPAKRPIAQSSPVTPPSRH